MASIAPALASAFRCAFSLSVRARASWILVADVRAAASGRIRVDVDRLPVLAREAELPRRDALQAGTLLGRVGDDGAEAGRAQLVDDDGGASLAPADGPARCDTHEEPDHDRPGHGAGF
jgi:hypothetical protein